MKNTNVKFTISIDIILFIILLILKLDGIIDWKWVWVFAPIWMMWVISALITIVVAISEGVAKWKLNSLLTKPLASGPRLVWDPKTSTLYGPWSAEDNETESE